MPWMHQCDSDDLDDKFSTSMVWNMPSKTQTPSLVHGLLQLQRVLMIYSWLILNAIVFRSLQYSWIIVQMFLKTKPLHFTVSQFISNKTLDFTVFFIILSFQVFTSFSDPMFIVITYIFHRRKRSYEPNTNITICLQESKSYAI